MTRHLVPPRARPLATALCEKLEMDWRVGHRRPLYEYLAGVPADAQLHVLAELVRCEMDLRRAFGEHPDPAEYSTTLSPLGAWAAEAVREGAGEDSASVTLVAVEGPNLGRRLRFTAHDTFLIGRSPEAHFYLPDDDALSRMHFLIELNPPLCRLTDLSSRNGTSVNGARVESHTLADGELIRAGLTVLRVGISVPTPDPVPQETRMLEPPAQETLPARQPPALAPTRPQTGSVSVPGYTILSELGRGGMGAVHSARRLADGATVAIKTILPAFAATPRAVALFQREADILRQLEHPNIVRYREFGEVEGFLYCVTDYVAGTDAAKLVKAQGRLAVGHALGLAVQLCEALAYAHDRGFVHRDVKPGNVLTDGGRALLADFGLARAYEASGLSGLTLAGQAGGTAAFMAPEQVTDFRNVKPAADQYAVAATLYYLLTGEAPIQVSGPPSVMFRAVLLHPRGDLAVTRPDAPVGLAAVLSRALKLQPRERYADVTQFARALEPFR